jgi:hypothetical protein
VVTLIIVALVLFIILLTLLKNEEQSRYWLGISDNEAIVELSPQDYHLLREIINREKAAQNAQKTLRELKDRKKERSRR